MAAFGATLKDGGVLAVLANGTTITVYDHSNYDTNTDSGHTQADFSDFRKIVFSNPDGTSYVFSSIGDGDEVITAADVAILPILTTYYYSTGDGVYNVCLMTVPTWNIAATYTTGMCVWYNDTLWRALMATTGDVPGVDATRWIEITETSLPARYRYCENFAVYCDTIACFMEYVRRTICGFNALSCTDNVCDSSDFQKAGRLEMILNAIPQLVLVGDWDSVEHIINLARQICCCYE